MEPVGSDDRTPVMIWSTWPDEPSARAGARALVEARLAACAVILPAIASVYRWNGAVEEATEVGLLVKTRAGRRDAAMAAIARDHPYEVPAILALTVEAAARAYGDWIVAATSED
ncbi:divalent-cation tolerance protein CutA [Pinisolibacter aquiterrae]|uniref:divalent-cation tolerance protein CutA n=1 Tax=Pinisolibacter aquiterrae TaxID=2815579 RepID=UPI001C3D174E|nr:divalent-cation tolerance protein CutA [Pinisolibacter aquiterrae]MBV5264094.1 divalent-cation tolerance protein CutA [Pinisolibacter aquiterrae]MCC8233811.1 divalent-cation tolerance protein CutA [Pinisolibacter aquiterrae]